jgi:hypothetical protein
LGGLGLGALGGGVVHGTYTVHNGSGYKTVVVQTGTVSSVSTTQIKVASPDGYTYTYAVIPQTIVNAQAGGISSVSANDQVSVTATPGSPMDTATNIVDTTKLNGSRQFFGYGPPPGNGGTPPPSTSKSSSPA